MSLRIRGSEWRRVEKNLDLSAAYVPTLCDPLNQIDIGSTLGRLPSALPKGAKVKAVQESNALNGLAVAVYSTAGQLGVYPVVYDVRVALLQSTRSGDYVLNSTDLASEYGMFCGVVQGADTDHYYVLIDEPSGSSDFLALYAYAIVR